MNKNTYVPLPTISDFLSIFIKKSLNIFEILSGVPKKNILYFSRSAWAIRFIAELRIFIYKRSINVWLPDYYCNETTYPIRINGVNIFFYKLNNNHKPDYEWCRDNSNKFKPDIFIHVHYFGQIETISDSKLFCQSNNAWLIEDAVHCLHPIKYSDMVGDFVLYSPYKYFAIPDGSILVIKDLEFINYNIIKLYTSFILKFSRINFNILKWFSKRILQMMFNFKLNITEFNSVNNNNHNIYKNARLSNIGKKLMIINYHNIDKIYKNRIKNHLEWEHYFKHHNFINFKLNSYQFIMEFNNDEDTLKFYKILKLNNFPVSTWPDLASEILINKDIHFNAINLRNRRIYLSIHQTLNLPKFKNLYV